MAPVAPSAPVLRVTAVIDGDTVEVSTGERVRLVGIDTPEAGTGDCAAKATARLTELVRDRSVTLVPGARDDTDRYHRRSARQGRKSRDYASFCPCPTRSHEQAGVVAVPRYTAIHEATALIN